MVGNELLFPAQAAELAGIKEVSLGAKASLTRGKRPEEREPWDAPLPADYVECVWTELDHGLWELRAPDGTVVETWVSDPDDAGRYPRRKGQHRVRKPRYRRADIVRWRKAMEGKPAQDRPRDDKGHYLPRASLSQRCTSASSSPALYRSRNALTTWAPLDL